MMDGAAATALTRLDASVLAEKLRSGEVSAREALEAHVGRYRASHQSLNAVVRTSLTAARERADELDVMAARGAYAGALHGVPMTVKDTFDVAGMPASAGRVDYGSRPASLAPEAELVSRLRQAGAVIWGKTNTSYMALGHDTGNSLYGPTSNPFDLGRSAGGSSGGSAAAVAACISPLELGSDIGGSLRVPAHFCGVCALKTSFGLLPLSGHVPPAPGSRGGRDLNVAGPLARRVTDLRLAMRVLAPEIGISGRGPSRLDGQRIAAWVAEDDFCVSAACEKAVGDAEAACRQLGAHVARARPDLNVRRLLSVYMSLLFPVLSVDLSSAAWTALQILRPLASLLARADGYGIAEAMTATTASHRQWLRADAEREQMRQSVEAFFSSWDAIICPVAPVTAFGHPSDGRLARWASFAGGDAARMSFWSVLASALRLPALVMPVTAGRDGLPAGVQLVGATGSEALLLDIAEALSSAVEGYTAALLAI